MSDVRASGRMLTLDKKGLEDENDENFTTLFWIDSTIYWSLAIAFFYVFVYSETKNWTNDHFYYNTTIYFAAVALGYIYIFVPIKMDTFLKSMSYT